MSYYDGSYTHDSLDHVIPPSRLSCGTLTTSALAYVQRYERHLPWVLRNLPSVCADTMLCRCGKRSYISSAYSLCTSPHGRPEKKQLSATLLATTPLSIFHNRPIDLRAVGGGAGTRIALCCGLQLLARHQHCTALRRTRSYATHRSSKKSRLLRNRPTIYRAPGLLPLASLTVHRKGGMRRRHGTTLTAPEYYSRPFDIFLHRLTGYCAHAGVHSAGAASRSKAPS